jgi:hypothetical protein
MAFVIKCGVMGYLPSQGFSGTGPCAAICQDDAGSSAKDPLRREVSEFKNHTYHPKRKFAPP